MLRTEGVAKKSTVVQSFATVPNKVMDPILIYGLSMDVTEAVLASLGHRLARILNNLRKGHDCDAVQLPVEVHIPLVNLSASVMGNAIILMASAAYRCLDKSKIRGMYVYTLKIVLACSQPWEC